MWDQRCKITMVKDGDTVRIYLDEGKERFEYEDVRLFGTFAPEKDQVGGPETKAFAEQWVRDNNDGSDWPFVRISMRNHGDTKEQMSFTRYVGMIWNRAMTHCLNVEVSNFVRTQGYSGGTGS